MSDQPELDEDGLTPAQVAEGEARARNQAAERHRTRMRFIEAHVDECIDVLTMVHGKLENHPLGMTGDHIVQIACAVIESLATYDSGQDVERAVRACESSLDGIANSR